MMLTPHKYKSQGFTLIEVIVALAIIAIAMGAVMTAVTANVGNAAALKERTIAHWVAMNKMAEMQATQTYPQRSSNDTMEMAGQEWHVQVESSRMDLRALGQQGINTQDYKQIDVQVRLAEDAEYFIVSLTSFYVQ